MYRISKIFLATLLNLSVLTVFSQSADTPPSTEAFKLSDGIKFHFNEGNYQFGIGGMLQPFIGLNQDTAGNNEYLLNSRRTFFNLSGKALKEKVSFFVQTDFNLSNSLMDAWIAYEPSSFLKISLGQKINFANNKEMGFQEGQLVFLERSLLSTQFANTGREFGLFIETNFKLGGMVFEPMASITSGDGRNSFGAGPTDFDYGGLKYGGRLNWLPLGKFKSGNNLCVADFGYEEQLRFVVGASGSINKGATEENGEGHGDFILYDNAGKEFLPDYRKLNFDVLAKYKGLSLLGEYIIATGKVANGTYKDITALNPLRPTEISQFLALGRGFNTQAGYVYKKRLGIDVRYAFVEGEFEDNVNSLVDQRSEFTLGLSYYVNKNNLKINAAFSEFNTRTSSSVFGSFGVQLMF